MIKYDIIFAYGHMPMISYVKLQTSKYFLLNISINILTAPLGFTSRFTCPLCDRHLSNCLKPIDNFYSNQMFDLLNNNVPNKFLVQSLFSGFEKKDKTNNYILGRLFYFNIFFVTSLI